jgi:hypothetical protein
MAAVVCFVTAVSSGGGGTAAGSIRKKEVLTVPSTSTITANKGEYAIVLNTEATAILVAYGSTPDAQAVTETGATTAGIGVPTGLDSALLGPLGQGDKVDVKTVA